MLSTFKWSSMKLPARRLHIFPAAFLGQEWDWRKDLRCAGKRIHKLLFGNKQWHCGRGLTTRATAEQGDPQSSSLYPKKIS